MTVLDRVAKTKGALAFEKVQVPQRASRFFFSPLLSSSSPLPANDCGFYNKNEEKKCLPFLGRATGKGSLLNKAFPLRESFPSLAR